MIRTYFLIFFLLLLSACSAPKDGGGETGTPEEEFSVTFNNLRTHGNLLSYSVQGDSNRNFGVISFHTANDCSNSSRLNSGDRTDLVSGMVVNLTGANTSHLIYYSVDDTDGTKLIACEELINYTHDSVAPSAPVFAPASLISQHGTRTRFVPFIPQIGSSFIPADADGIRFYGNLSKSIYMGEILRPGLMTSAINLLPNSANLFYISFVDLAGNESSLYSTGVAVVNDSIAPTTPVATLALTRYTTTPTVQIQATLSGDTTSVRITHQESMTSNDYSSASVTSGVFIPSTANATNTYNVVAYDDVGNASLPLVYVVVNDSIIPNSPTLHADTAELISVPVRGPSNTFKFLMDEPGTISVYSDSGLSSLVISGVDSAWSSGISFPLTSNDGPNTFYVVARDPSGNASVPMALTFTADTTNPPNLVLHAGTQALNNSSQQGINAPIRGNSHPDISRIIVTGGASLQNYSMSDIASGVNYALSPNAINNLLIRSVDLAGNISAGVPLVVTNDTIAPAATITFPLPGKTIAGNGVVTGTCETGPVQLTVGSVFSVPCVGGLFNFQLDGSRTHNSNVTIIAREVDAALNETVINRPSVIDNLAPVMTIDPVTLPAVSNNHNHLIMGTCENGPTVYITGDYSGAIPCLAGFFVVPLSIATEGMRNFTVTQTDDALNVGTTNFSLNFDFTAPPQITLAQSVLRIHNTATDAATINIVGTSPENVPVKIFSDASLTELVGTYTQAGLSSGISLPLGSDRENSFFVVAEDAAGNRSTPALVTVFQRLALSKKYETIQSNIYLSSDIGTGVSYKYRINVQNESFDTNINRRIILESLQVTSPTPQIVVDPASSCLTGSIAGFASCEIIVTITYALPHGAKDHDLTIRYPNNTTKTLRIQHFTASVTGSAITPTGIGQNIFSNDLYETTLSEAFLNMPNFVDFNLLTYGTTDLAKRRRVQTSSPEKVYSVCASRPTYDRVCVYDKTSPAMEEHMFTTPALVVSDLDGLNTPAPANPNNIPNTMFWYIGSIGNKDFLIVSKHMNNAFTSGQDSALLAYDRLNQTSQVFPLVQGTDRISVQRPQSGKMLVGNNFYFMGLYTGNQALYRLDLTTGALTRLETARNSSGYMRVNDKLIYSKSNNDLVSMDLLTTDEDVITSVNASSDLHICRSDLFMDGKVMNVEDMTDSFSLGYHGLYFMCNGSNAKQKMVYTDGEDFEELLTTTNNMHFQNINFINTDKVLFTVRRYTSNLLHHFYIDRTLGTVSTISEGFPDANYKAAPYYINGKIYKQAVNDLVEYDLNFTPLRTINNFGHRDWYLFESKNTPFVLQVGARIITYYDMDFNQWLTYQTLTTGGMITGTVWFEGYYRGMVYMRDNGPVGQKIVRVPLYSK